MVCTCVLRPSLRLVRLCSSNEKDKTVATHKAKSLIKRTKFGMEKYKHGKLVLGDPTALNKWNDKQTLPISMPRLDTKHNVLKVLRDEFLLNPLDRPEFVMPREVEFLVVGGGVTGSSLAYFLKKDHSASMSTLLVDQDLTGLSSFSSGCPGIVSFQAADSEELQLISYSLAFLRQHSMMLTCDNKLRSFIPFSHSGILTLPTPEGAPLLVDTHRLQDQFGLPVEILDSQSVSAQFPWMRLPHDFELAALSKGHSGVVCPSALTRAYRQKAMKLGAIFATGRVINVQHELVDNGRAIPRFAEILTPEGRIYSVKAHTFINATGVAIPEVADLFCSEKCLPISSRTVLNVNIHCPRGPILGMPVIQTDSFSLHSLDLANNYRLSMICPDSPPSHIYDHPIWKELTDLIPVFEECRVTELWTSLEDVSSRPLIGRHPQCPQLFCVGGLGARAVQLSPAVGMLAAKMLLDEDPAFDSRPYAIENVFANHI